MFPLLSGRSTSRDGRPVGCLAALAPKYRRSPLVARSLSRLGGTHTMGRQAPRSACPATRNTAPHLPKQSERPVGSLPPYCPLRDAWAQEALVCRTARCSATGNCCLTAPALAGHALDCPIRAPMAILLAVCSQTVRIHPDVSGHVRGKYAGQAHNGGRVCTWWDGLVGSSPGIPTMTDPGPPWIRPAMAVGRHPLASSNSKREAHSRCT